jgi:cytochrome c peroxidase
MHVYTAAPRVRMMPFMLIAAMACGSDGSTTTGATAPVAATTAAPALVSANDVVATAVGTAVRYDASKGGLAFTDPGARGLTYSIAFSPSSNGLSAIGCDLAGTPSAPGVTIATITATDALGRTATDRFAIVAFAPGLLSPTLPAVSYAYSDSTVPLPAQFSVQGPGGAVLATDNMPTTNRTTDAGATLGRVLFYDPRLSANDKQACASCHIQSLGFGDTATLSRGFTGGLTTRHTTGLANARFYARGRFFWDERAATLEDQVLQPIQNPVEMGMTLDTLVRKLVATTYYRPLFQAAFGSTDVTSDRISRALAQYVRSIVSTGSKFDRAFTGNGPANFAGVFTAQEQQGEALFRSAGCARCHVTNAHVSDGIHNTGLDATITDVGAGNGQFKAPSLRNVALRPAYMHDGRFTSLAQVVEFYDHGVQPNPGLDNRLRGNGGAPLRLNLSTADKAALVAFLNTLTDSTMISAAKFSNPFR